MVGLAPGTRGHCFGEGRGESDATPGAVPREAPSPGDWGWDLLFHHIHHEERLRKGAGSEEEEDEVDVSAALLLSLLLLLPLPLASRPATPAVELSNSAGAPAAAPVVACARDGAQSGGVTRPTSEAVITSAAARSGGKITGQ